MHFIGAAKSEGEPAIICLSRDEDDYMECISSDSVEDLASSSDDETEEVQPIARCLERQLADPIPIHTTGTAESQKRCATPGPNQPPFPSFSQMYFSLGNGNGPLACEDRVRNNHHINVCRNLIPQADTQLSPHVPDRGPDCGASVPSCSYSDESVTIDSISNHFRGMAVSETSTLVNYSDCVICGKSVPQIQSEAVNDYQAKQQSPKKRSLIEKQEGELPSTECLGGRSYLCQGSVAGGRLRWELFLTLPGMIPFD